MEYEKTGPESDRRGPCLPGVPGLRSRSYFGGVARQTGQRRSLPSNERFRGYALPEALRRASGQTGHPLAVVTCFFVYSARSTLAALFGRHQPIGDFPFESFQVRGISRLEQDQPCMIPYFFRRALGDASVNEQASFCNFVTLPDEVRMKALKRREK